MDLHTVYCFCHLHYNIYLPVGEACHTDTSFSLFFMFIEFCYQHVAVKMFSLLFRKRTPKRMSSIKRDLDARARSDAFRLRIVDLT